ncbi:MAG: MBL fold metallo-hydrolase [Pseudomonadota bacterium]|nr:MAG: MBL fold metallo-hydrolase [Pseudomonadota bacterium]
MTTRRLLLAAAVCAWLPATYAQGCDRDGVQFQVLGSGGPELQGRRAGTSYLLWIDGAARVLIDFGSGAALRFGESGARGADLDVLLFSHLHIDHTSDFPALVKSTWFENRTRVLPIYGPGGNKHMPSTVSMVRELFDPTRGVYRYLGTLLSPIKRDGFRLEPHDVRERPPKIGLPKRDDDDVLAVFSNERVKVTAIHVTHAEIPALAWRIEAAGKSVVVSGDASGDADQLVKLARDADLLVAHNAVPESAVGVEARLHMRPSMIGEIARGAAVKQLVLSHRMLRTLGNEEETLAQIGKHYSGPTTFASDLDCFAPVQALGAAEAGGR